MHKPRLLKLKQRKVFWYVPLLLILLLAIICYQYLLTRIHPHKDTVDTTNQQLHTRLHVTDSLSVSSDSFTASRITESVSDRDLHALSPRLSHTSMPSNVPPLPKATNNMAMEMPNIIFAMADDLGWGDVQYNNGKAHTPNLNKMASNTNSVLLQRYYSGGSVCSPTRGTVLTGRNHNRYCLWDANVARGTGDFTKPEILSLPLSEISAAKVMREAGYSTALFGKWHIGDFKALKGGNKKWPVSHPGLHGFDQWQATERSAPTCTVNCACFKQSDCELGHYTYPPPCTNYYTNKSDGLESWPELIPGDDSHFIWSLAEKYIREQVRVNKPFFLYLPFHTVHMPYIAAQQYRVMYLDQKFSLKQADYYGAITALDDVIGKIRKLLKELGIRDNTLLWFSSDNGPENNTPGTTNGLRGRKRSLYEGGIRVPGIIEWPSIIKRNKVSSFPVVSSDLLPTLRDIVGIKPTDNRSIDGISILPFLQGKVEKRNHLIHWAYNIKGDFEGVYNTASSGDQYKLVTTYEYGKVVNHQLFDLINDPGETRDVSISNPAISSEMLNQVEEWRKSVISSVNKVGCVMYKNTRY